jgi:hypothetical protein
MHTTGNPQLHVQEKRKRNELQSNKDTNTVENYNNLDIITATVFYWKNPMNNALR